MKDLLLKYSRRFKNRYLRFYLGKKRFRKTDLVGYEKLIKFITKKNIISVSGDFVEIGTFLGGGALKLSQFLSEQRSKKTLYVIDVFNLDFDRSDTVDGICMADFYKDSTMQFKGLSQKEIFDIVTFRCKNIELITGDSKNIRLPADHLSFGFIDGNHSPDYVRSDFELIWEKLSPNGCVAFHDYGGDLPEVTRMIDLLISENKKEIKEISVNDEGEIIFLIKK